MGPRDGVIATQQAGAAGRSGAQRDRICLAAVRLFNAYGYAGTSMKRLATELSMVQANLYNYYPNKEAILFDVLTRQLDQLLLRMEQIVEDVPDPVARLCAYARDIVLDDLRNPLAAFVGEQGTSGLCDANRRHVSGLMRRVRQAWFEVIVEGIRAGVFTSPAPKLDTIGALTLCSTVSSWYRSDGSFSEEEVADYVADAVLRIVGCTTGRRP